MPPPGSRVLGEPQRQGDGTLAAPASWEHAIAERHWASLDPEVQRYLLQREQEAHRKITQQGQLLSQWAPLEQLRQQHAQWLSQVAQRGADLPTVVQASIGFQQAYERDPLRAVLSMLPAEQLHWLDQQTQLATQAQRNAQLFEAAMLERQQIAAHYAHQQAVQQAEQKKRDEEQAEAAERARRNGALPRRGSSVPMSAGKRTINDTLTGVAKKHFEGWHP